jgi:type I protein arginine methyltransferase
MTTPAQFDFDSYSELALQRLMVADRPRTEGFSAAIREVVQPGDRVIDVGTGTGLLAMFAAKAGASKVYALEQAAIARVAEELVARNGLPDVVKVLQQKAERFAAAEPVDLIVSEWLGNFAFTEAMVQKVLACRDRNLRPGGTMLPSGVEILLAPVESTHLYDQEGPGFWDITIDGIDFSWLEAGEIAQAIAIKSMVQPEELLAGGLPIAQLEMATATEADLWPSGELEFTIERSGTCHGFAGWFVAQLSPSVPLDTGPGAPCTHWMQTFLPFKPVKVEEGQRIRLAYSLRQHPYERTSVELELSVLGQRLKFSVN